MRAEARRKTASLRAPAARALEAAEEVADVADAALGPGHAEQRHEEQQRVAEREGDREDDQGTHRREERQLAREEEHRRAGRRDGPRQDGLAHLSDGVVELLLARRESLAPRDVEHRDRRGRGSVYHRSKRGRLRGGLRRRDRHAVAPVDDASHGSGIADAAPDGQRLRRRARPHDDSRGGSRGRGRVLEGALPIPIPSRLTIPSPISPRSGRRTVTLAARRITSYPTYAPGTDTPPGDSDGCDRRLTVNLNFGAVDFVTRHTGASRAKRLLSNAATAST